MLYFLAVPPKTYWLPFCLKIKFTYISSCCLSLSLCLSDLEKGNLQWETIMMVKLYHNCRLIHFFLFLSFVGTSMCEVFLVGDEDGWNSGINFANWSQNHNFTKGDFLGIHQFFSSFTLYHYFIPLFTSFSLKLFFFGSNCWSFLL